MNIAVPVPDTRTEPRLTRFANRLAVVRAGLSKPAAGLIREPEPRSIGRVSQGQQILAGNLLLAGHFAEAPGIALWDIPGVSREFQIEAQSFAWLDDLAAVGNAAARVRAQNWTSGWISRFGRGVGPGWTPEVMGRRLIRWTQHAAFLTKRQDEAQTRAFLRAMSVQTRVLSRRWTSAASGLPRIEAQAGLIHAALALTGMEALATPALAALARECATVIDAQGGIASRNPEELLAVLALLTWVSAALDEAARTVPQTLRAAIGRMVPTLRTLRHADGGLARFHGGGCGMAGQLDHALAASGTRPIRGHAPAMGFLRLAGGRTTVIIDAADPPQGAAAHASTLAFEMTSGRRPMVVSCGSGAPFGQDWLRAGRATPSHSTLSIDGYSSSRLGPGTPGILTDRAHVVQVSPAEPAEGHVLRLAQDGWVATHGLTHSRLFVLSHDGRHLGGQDELRAATPQDRERLSAAIAQASERRLGFCVRFHLHPDVEATIDTSDSTVTLVLKSGEIWIFRHSGAEVLTVEPSVYLEKGRLSPRATRQIVLSGQVAGFSAQIGWTLAKASQTPVAVRDLEPGHAN